MTGPAPLLSVQTAGPMLDAYRVDARTVAVVIRETGARFGPFLTADADGTWGYPILTNNGLGRGRNMRPAGQTATLVREMYGDWQSGRLPW